MAEYEIYTGAYDNIHLSVRGDGNDDMRRVVISQDNDAVWVDKDNLPELIQALLMLQTQIEEG